MLKKEWWKRLFSLKFLMI